MLGERWQVVRVGRRRILWYIPRSERCDAIRRPVALWGALGQKPRLGAIATLKARFRAKAPLRAEFDPSFAPAARGASTFCACRLWCFSLRTGHPPSFCRRVIPATGIAPPRAATALQRRCALALELVPLAIGGSDRLDPLLASPPSGGCAIADLSTDTYNK